MNPSSDFLMRVNRKIYHYINKIGIIPRLFCARGKVVYLFGCPIHSNIGDQAQTYCIEKWLMENYPDYKTVKFNWSTSYPLALKVLRWKIGKEDKIFCHSGYFMVDHHRELPVYCRIAEVFPDFRIVIFRKPLTFTI